MPTRSNLTNRKSAVKANDWKLVKKQVEADEPIAFDPEVDPYDPNDEAAVQAFWASATITRGRGRPPVAVKRPTLNMRVDAEILEAFKATGPGWQTRINSLLRDAVKSGAVRSWWPLRKEMTKRNLFAEMTEGFDALAAARKGKKTLRTTEVELKPVVEVSAEDLSAIGETQSVAPSVCMLPEN